MGDDWHKKSLRKCSNSIKIIRKYLNTLIDLWKSQMAMEIFTNDVGC
jgi:hypothetical protein